MNQNIFEIRISQGSAIKQVFNQLRTFTSKCNMIIDGNKFWIMHRTDSVFIKICLETHYFDYFCCSEPKIITGIGLDVHELNDALNTINEEYSVSLSISEWNRNELLVKMIRSNHGLDITVNRVIKLIPPEDNAYHLAKIDFSCKISLSPTKLREIYLSPTKLREIYRALCDYKLIKIEYANNKIYFTGNNRRNSLTFSQYVTTKNDYQGDYIGYFRNKQLSVFNQLNKNSKIDLYLKNDSPLCLVIPIPSNLGRMSIFLTPISYPKKLDLKELPVKCHELLYRPDSLRFQIGDCHWNLDKYEEMREKYPNLMTHFCIDHEEMFKVKIPDLFKNIV